MIFDIHVFCVVCYQTDIKPSDINTLKLNVTVVQVLLQNY